MSPEQARHDIERGIPRRVQEGVLPPHDDARRFTAAATSTCSSRSSFANTRCCSGRSVCVNRPEVLLREGDGLRRGDITDHGEDGAVRRVVPIEERLHVVDRQRSMSPIASGTE